MEYDLDDASTCKGVIKTEGSNKVLEISKEKCSSGYRLDAFMEHFFPGVDLKGITNSKSLIDLSKITDRKSINALIIRPYC